jgi:transcription elongation factor GreA-like protein
MDAIYRNDSLSLRMYQELLALSFIPMSFLEMKQKYYIKKQISQYTNHELYDIWNRGVDYIFSDTHCALT